MRELSCFTSMSFAPSLSPEMPLLSAKERSDFAVGGKVTMLVLITLLAAFLAVALFFQCIRRRFCSPKQEAPQPEKREPSLAQGEEQEGSSFQLLKQSGGLAVTA
ncbi:hypothetical protein AAHA92_20550 [Salvia divinorum]|uniref:Uncharacterized protein n=1 Tax=Salvia divinorum TaxID=28513 RepID=A0ABD1GKW0_SALDI